MENKPIQMDFLNPISYSIIQDHPILQTNKKIIYDKYKLQNQSNALLSDNDKQKSNKKQSLTNQSIIPTRQNRRNNDNKSEQRSIKYTGKLQIDSHSGWVWNNKLYILGGNLTKIDNQDNSRQIQKSEVFYEKSNQNNLNLSTYDFQNKQWFKTQLIKKNNFIDFNQLPNLKKSQKNYFNLHEYSSIAFYQDNSVVYLFGGCHKTLFQCNNIFWKFDMEKLNYQKIDQKGQIPQSRQGAKIVKYDQNWLILYGGYNISQVIIYNDFYAYNIHQQTWHNMTGPFEYLLNARLQTSLTFHILNKSIYLFGGWLMNFDYDKQYLQDMYIFNILDLELATKRIKDSKKEKGKVQMRQILCQIYPQKRAGHQLIYLNQIYLMLVGGYNEISNQIYFEQQKQQKINQSQNLQSKYLIKPKQKYFDDIWLFNVRIQKWFKIVNEQSLSIHKRSNFILANINNSKNNQYCIFGGKSNDYKFSLDNIVKIKINLEQNYQNKRLNVQKPSVCCICSENSFQISNQSQFSCQQIDQFIYHGIKFPFIAIGILINLLIQKQAKKVNIEYRIKQNNQQNVLILQNDSKIAYKANQIQFCINSLVFFDSLELQSSDKKYRTNIGRKKQIISYFNSLKIAALRLGQELLYIASSQGQTLVYCLRKQSLNGIKYFKSYFYAIDQTTHQLIDQNYMEIAKKIQSYYPNCIQQFIKDKKTNQIIRISKLRKIQIKQYCKKQYIYQLLPNIKYNTIIINEQYKKIRKFIHSDQIRNQHSIDINLRTYISMLYISIKTHFFIKVSLNYNNNNNNNNKLIKTQQNKFQQIYSHPHLPKVDYLVKQGKIIQIDRHILSQFDCKFVQIYYDPNQYKKFNNNINDNNNKDNKNNNNNDKNINDQQNNNDFIYPNGLLFYHKNKLVSRYKYPLGYTFTFNQHFKLKDQKEQCKNKRSSIIKSNKQSQYSNNENKTQNKQKLINFRLQNQMKIFGIISIPDRIPINVFQSDFLYPQMIDRLGQKIQHISFLYQKAYLMNDQIFNETKIQKQNIENNNKKQKNISSNNNSNNNNKSNYNNSNKSNNKTLNKNIKVNQKNKRKNQRQQNQQQLNNIDNKQLSIIDLDDQLTPEQEIIINKSNIQQQYKQNIQQKQQQQQKINILNNNIKQKYLKQQINQVQIQVLIKQKKQDILNN